MVILCQKQKLSSTKIYFEKILGMNDLDAKIAEVSIIDDLCDSVRVVKVI